MQINHQSLFLKAQQLAKKYEHNPFGLQSILTSENEKCLKILSQYGTNDFLERMLNDGKHLIKPRDKNNPPCQTGLKCLIAYTSCGLDSGFRLLKNPDFKKLEPNQYKNLIMLEELAVETLNKIQPTKPTNDVVYRNLYLNNQAVEQAKKQYTMNLNPITSVSFSYDKSFITGNVDLVIQAPSGVIDVKPLSIYAKKNQSENEALLLPGGKIVIESIANGRDRSQSNSPTAHQDNPQLTIFCKHLMS